MTLNSVRRSTVVLGAAAVAVALAGCEDNRVKSVDKGITSDSAITVMSRNAVHSDKPDSMPNIYKKNTYLIAGKHMEVLWFDPQDRRIGGKDTIPERQLTPIVTVDNVVIGKGWPFWDSTAKANKISVPAK